MILLIGCTFFIGFYCILAQALKTAPFKVSGIINSVKIRKKSSTIRDILRTVSLSLSKYIPLSMIRTIKLTKLLNAASIEKTPKEYVADLAVKFSLVLILVLIGFFIAPIFGGLLLIADFVFIFILYNDIVTLGRERFREIEGEIPNFISNFVNSIKTNRNIIEIIDTYRRSYSNELTKELAITVADMRTGSQEVALQRLEARIDIPLFSELIRGVLSTMQGEDMTVYFNNLIVKSNDSWRQSLTKQAYKVKPKVSMLSMLLAGYSMVALLIVFVQVGISQGGGLF